MQPPPATPDPDHAPGAQALVERYLEHVRVEKRLAPRTVELYRQFRGRCQLAFGIGTNLTNDLGYEPLQIVIKMVRCNGQPVAKLSDTPSKNMCDDERYLAYLRQVFEIPQVV